MANEIIMLQLGQCGNQIGLEFWKSLCKDHNIDPNGEISSTLNRANCSSIEKADIFFYQADDKRYVPRSVLVDLEPRVINYIMNSEYSKLFDEENILISTEGGGAGNNWAKGYVQSRMLEENLFDIIDRMTEDCESLNGIMMCHSMAGGTGSGMGSFILECLSERYPKKTVQTLSVFPRQDEMGDVVVQAYNSLLMMQRLVMQTDAVFVLHNGAFQRIMEEHWNKNASSFTEINELIIRLLNSFTNPLRFPTYQYNTLTSLIAPLAPTSSMHFLTSSLTPWNSKSMKKKPLRRMIYDLLNAKNMSTSAEMKSTINHGYLAILDIIQGDYDPTKVFDAIGYIRENQYARFVPWVPDSLQVILANASPNCAQNINNHNSGMMVANYTGISVFLEKILEQFDKLKKKRAFLGQFLSTGVFSEDLAEMDLARNVADCLLQEYNAATKADFLQWTPKVDNVV